MISNARMPWLASMDPRRSAMWTNARGYLRSSERSSHCFFAKVLVYSQR